MIKKVSNKLKQVLYLIKYFGFRQGLFEFLSAIFGTESILGKKFNFYKHENAKKYIRTRYGNIIQELKEKEEEMKKKETPISENQNVWIFWWQGEEGMPLIVKQCIKSIKKYMGNHQVIVLSEENLFQYVEVPEEIYNKLKEGKFTITNFSDYIRCLILSQYGGIWLDSTIFLTDNIDYLLKGKKFFSVKHGENENVHVCKGKWMTSVLSAGENNYLFLFCKSILEEYLKREDMMITYLLIDCIIAIAYEEIDSIKQEIDIVEKNNEKYIYMDHNFLEKYDGSIDNVLISQNIHKLSYKVPYYSKNEDTNYHYIVRKILEQ